MESVRYARRLRWGGPFETAQVACWLGGATLGVHLALFLLATLGMQGGWAMIPARGGVVALIEGVWVLGYMGLLPLAMLGLWIGVKSLRRERRRRMRTAGWAGVALSVLAVGGWAWPVVKGSWGL